MRNERAWPQQCWKSCANGSNIVALRFGDHATKKEVLGVVGWKVWPVSNFAQQHATTSNNMQQGVQTDATCNIQQCWELLVNNVASVCTQPNTLNVLCFSLQLDRDLLALQSVLNGTDLVLQSAIDSLKLIVANVNQTLQNKVCWDTDKVIIS